MFAIGYLDEAVTIVQDVAARSFTATIMLAKAIDNVHSTDPVAIQAALRDLPVVSAAQSIVTGGLDFDSDGQNRDDPGALLQVQAGRYVPIFPLRLAVGDARPRWPLRDAP